MKVFEKHLDFDYKNFLDPNFEKNESLKIELLSYLVFSFLEPIDLTQVTEIIDKKSSIENQEQLTVIKKNIRETIDYYDFYVNSNPDFLTFAATVIRDEFTMIESDSSIKNLFLKRCKDLENEFEVYIYQKSYIDKNLEDLNDRYTTEIKRLNELQTSIESTEKELGDIKKNTYTDFVAILGIFSALIFGLFGGLQTIGSVVDLLTEKISIGYIVMALSIMVLCLTFFTILFFILLSHIIDKPIFNKKNTTYKLAMKRFAIFCLLTFVVGITVEIGKITGINNLFINAANGFPMYIALSLIIIFLCRLLLKKNKDE